MPPLPRWGRGSYLRAAIKFSSWQVDRVAVRVELFPRGRAQKFWAALGTLHRFSNCFCENEDKPCSKSVPGDQRSSLQQPGQTALAGPHDCSSKIMSLRKWFSKLRVRYPEIYESRFPRGGDIPICKMKELGVAAVVACLYPNSHPRFWPFVDKFCLGQSFCLCPIQ